MYIEPQLLRMMVICMEGDILEICHIGHCREWLLGCLLGHHLLQGSFSGPWKSAQQNGIHYTAPSESITPRHFLLGSPEAEGKAMCLTAAAVLVPHFVFFGGFSLFDPIQVS